MYDEESYKAILRRVSNEHLFSGIWSGYHEDREMLENVKSFAEDFGSRLDYFEHPCKNITNILQTGEQYYFDSKDDAPIGYNQTVIEFFKEVANVLNVGGGRYPRGRRSKATRIVKVGRRLIMQFLFSTPPDIIYLDFLTRRPKRSKRNCWFDAITDHRKNQYPPYLQLNYFNHGDPIEDAEYTLARQRRMAQYYSVKCSISTTVSDSELDSTLAYDFDEDHSDQLIHYEPYLGDYVNLPITGQRRRHRMTMLMSDIPLQPLEKRLATGLIQRRAPSGACKAYGTIKPSAKRFLTRAVNKIVHPVIGEDFTEHMDVEYDQ